MSDMKRLLEMDLGAEERSILEFAANERPTPERRMRIHQAIIAASTGSAASAAAGGAAAKGAQVLAVSSWQWLTGKAIVIGLSATVVTAGVVGTVLTTTGGPDDASRPVPARAIGPASTPPDTVEELREAPAQAELAEASDEDEAAMPELPHQTEKPAPALLLRQHGQASSAVGERPVRTDPDQLAEEVKLIDEARSALERGDDEAAEQALRQHDTQHKQGMLTPEATVIRIEVLLARGERAQAEQLAQSFLAKTPRGPHADRVRALLRR